MLSTVLDFLSKEDRKLVMLCKFGSHLYGTSTPESDTDFKGVFLPPYEEVLLNKAPKSIKLNTNDSNSKNTKDDVDCEIYSLHYFLDLCIKGETVSIDMLHVNEENLIITSNAWAYFQKNRSVFYSKNMKALIGYAKSQAAKYGIKGSRLHSAKKLKEFLEAQSPDDRIIRVIEAIPLDENTKITKDNRELTIVDFCGKKFQETVKVSYALNIVDRFIKQYGERAKMAETNEGVDWKAMSHAVRAGLQLEEIYRTGDLRFPLQDAGFLLDIKRGKYSFKFVMNFLENIIEKVEKLAQKSNYPNKVNSNIAKELLLNILKFEYRGE